MIADANIIAAGLFLLPLAMFSRRPLVPQNRGRVGAPVPSTGGTPSNVYTDYSGVPYTDYSDNYYVDYT